MNTEYNSLGWIKKYIIAVWIGALVFAVSSFGLYFLIDYFVGLETLEGTTMILLIVGIPMALCFVVFLIVFLGLWKKSKK